MRLKITRPSQTGFGLCFKSAYCVDNVTKALPILVFQLRSAQFGFDLGPIFYQKPFDRFGGGQKSRCIARNATCALNLLAESAQKTIQGFYIIFQSINQFC
jgi:hypothetical protein